MTTTGAPPAPQSGAPRPSLRPNSLVPPGPPKPVPAWARFTERMRSISDELGAMAVLFWETVKSIPRRPFEMRALVYQVEQMGVRSVAIACVTAIFVGMVMAVQFAFGLERFGARDYVGRVVGISITRELAPALTSLVVGSRIGAGMAAELGSMAVTEQLDAIRALGADPIKKLVVPRMLACIVLMPILCVFANVLGFIGAMVVSSVQFGTGMAFFYQSALDSVDLSDFMSGLGKTPFFGILIALIGCHHGMETRGGTEGVGRSTTRTVVFTSIAVLVSDFFLSKLFIMLTPTE